MLDIKSNRLVFFRDELGADEVVQVGSEFYNKLMQPTNGDYFFRIFGATGGSQVMQAGIGLVACAAHYVLDRVVKDYMIFSDPECHS